MKRVLIVLAAVFSLSAQAYIPPSRFIVKTVGDKRGGVKKLRIRSEVIALEDDKPSSSIRFKETTVYDASTGLLKSWVTDAQNRDLYGVVRKGGAISPAALMIMEGNSDSLTAMLKSRGIPIKTQEELNGIDDEATRAQQENSTLARTGTTLAWILGPRDSGPQLWVEKDTFLPLRLICRMGSYSLAEVHYDSYRFYREFPYPRTITVAKSAGSSPMFREELIEVMVYREHTKMDARTAASERELQGYTDAGNSAPGAIRDLISLYYDIVR